MYGVMKYLPNRLSVKGKGIPQSNIHGNQFFSPIFKGGEFGQQVKYLAKGTVLLKMPGGKWQEFTRAELKAQQADFLAMQNHPKTKIGRSGLAKKVWQWCKGHTRTGGSGTIMSMPGLASVKWGGADRSTLTLQSNLRYAVDALKGKGSELGNIMGKASQMMAKRIDLLLEKKAKEMAR
jgi:hypothetical protein